MGYTEKIKKVKISADGTQASLGSLVLYGCENPRKSIVKTYIQIAREQRKFIPDQIPIDIKDGFDIE